MHIVTESGNFNVCLELCWNYNELHVKLRTIYFEVNSFVVAFDYFTDRDYLKQYISKSSTLPSLNLFAVNNISAEIAEKN